MVRGSFTFYWGGFIVYSVLRACRRDFGGSVVFLVADGNLEFPYLFIATVFRICGFLGR